MGNLKLTLVTAAAVMFVLDGQVPAQLRIYDGARDAAAQEAKKAADKVKSGDVFKKQSQNLQSLVERDIATTVADARVEMQGFVDQLRAWSDVEDLKRTIRGELAPAPPEDIAVRKSELAQAKARLQGQIKSLSAAAENEADELKPVIERLGNIEAALQFADEHLGVNDPGVTGAMNALNQLQGLYKSYQDQFDAVNKAEKRLSELKVNVKKALLARLKVEEDYLLTQVALYARNEQELKATPLQGRCAIPAGVPRDEPIDETLDRLASNRPALERALGSLYACGSLAAEGMLPKRLLKLRLAHLEHMRSIQLSAANARIYEAVLGGGVERLALFYQGGVKPATLAQLLQSLSTAGVFGKLLTQ